MGFRVLGTGSALPERSVTNDELSEFLDTSDEWISQRTGISERRLCTTETLDDLALAASRAALDAAGVTADQLDLIVCSTTSGDHLMPAEACAVAELLGASCRGASRRLLPRLRRLRRLRGLRLRPGRGGRLPLPRPRRARARGRGREGQPSRGLDGPCHLRALRRRRRRRGARRRRRQPARGAPLHRARGRRPARPRRARHLPLRQDRAPRAAPRDGGPPRLQVWRERDRDLGHRALRRGRRRRLGRRPLRLPPGQRAHPLVGREPSRDRRRPRGARPRRDRQHLETGNISSACIPLALDRLARSGSLERGQLVALVGFGAGLDTGACLLRW